jgi:hypothetical protein
VVDCGRTQWCGCAAGGEVAMLPVGTRLCCRWVMGVLAILFELHTAPHFLEGGRIVDRRDERLKLLNTSQTPRM